jgi:hypothetical protein
MEELYPGYEGGGFKLDGFAKASSVQIIAAQ